MTLKIAQADAMIAAGTARARDLGIAAKIAVVDAAAQLKAFVRMDNAMLSSIDLSIGKVRTG